MSRIRPTKVGIFDHLSERLGGSQLVVAWLASVLSRTTDVELIHGGRGYRLPELAAAFEIDLGRVKERLVGDIPPTFARSLRDDLRGDRGFDRGLTEGYDLFIYSGHGLPPYSWAARGAAYCHFPFEPNPMVAADSDPRWSRRAPIDRWLRGTLYRQRWRKRQRGYPSVLANSRFTAGWIQRLWGISAEVVYPPVIATPFLSPQQRRDNVVASLGRFVRSDRKSAVAQIDAFRRVQPQLPGDWRLLMMGFCADVAEDREHLVRLRALARGLPVVFVVNAPRREILARLASAKIFWHTAALEDLRATEPRYMEHFGIATVEAMQLGCVPVVSAGGGQPEIVEHEISGFVCDAFEVLERHTLELARDDHRRSAMSKAAVKRGNVFRPDVFERRVLELAAGYDRAQS